MAGLETDGRDLVWLPEPCGRRVVLGVEYGVHEATLLALRRRAGRQYLIVKPTIIGLDSDGIRADDAADRELKRLVLTRQYNGPFSVAVNTWRRRLFGRVRVFEFPPNCGSSFRFTVRPNPAFATVTSGRSGRGMPIPESIRGDVAFRGMLRPEPALLFSNDQGQADVADPHPLRGIVNNKPYDYSVTRGGLSRQVRLGVVCPRRDAARLASYLSRLHLQEQPTSKSPYLVTYPGFAQALGLPLDVPATGAPGWIDCPEPTELADVRKGAQELERRLTASIEALQAAASPSVILVYVPTRWQPWERFEDESESFNLHNYVKASCAQRGVATQFLREATLSKGHQCEVRWWLALSFYVKSLRTPWVLDNLDRDTAFVGLGFSLDRTAPRGRHVIQGCSHIYRSDGLGLHYRLAKLETSEMRRGNPFMSRDDARRMGESVRQLFYDSHGVLPRRVVVHKRTPYRAEEREGLLEGLHGVNLVDMLEINIEDVLRYMASKPGRNGTLEADAYPIARGTAIVEDDQRALAWVHGATEAVDPRRPYYLGKSRIPAPMLLRRHYGTASLATLVDEVLGLSKMNWNSFDFYGRIPATIQSSNKIAEIGALLERNASQSYDYRLLI